MKDFIIQIRNVFVLFVFLGPYILCTGQEDNSISIAPMEMKEQEGLIFCYAGVCGEVVEWLRSLSRPLWLDSNPALNIGPVYDNSPDCTLNAEFSDQLFELKHLKTLSFYNCFIENSLRIPTSNWVNLANSLETLEFRSNPGLTGAIPTAFGSLKSLQSLVLLENGLTCQSPMDMGNLVNLKRLVLAGNRFVGQIPASWGSLTNLLILDSSRNSLSGSLPLTFVDSTSLLKLDLSKNLLEGELPIEIGNLMSLTLLDLSNNKFSGGLAKSLQEMVSLEDMVLSNNLIGGDLMSIQWENLQNLEIIDLSNLGLTGNIPDSMTELKRLRFLGLNNNNISGIISPRFEAMPWISALYLHGNNLAGRLEFSESFYGKMGSRFRASNNPNLCYSVELMESSHVPFGVKPCQ